MGPPFWALDGALTAELLVLPRPFVSLCLPVFQSFVLVPVTESVRLYGFSL